MSDRRIEVLFFDGCPNAVVALDRARDASKASGVSSTVTAVRVPNETEALRLLFLGSPTIRVDGQDVDPTAWVRPLSAQCAPRTQRSPSFARPLATAKARAKTGPSVPKSGRTAS